MLMISGADWRRFLFDKHWWHRSLVSIKIFAPQCFGPAVLFSLANVLALLVCAILEQQLLPGPSDQSADLERLLLVACTGLAGLLGTLALAVYSLSAFMVKLTAFARAFILSNGQPSADEFAEAF